MWAGKKKHEPSFSGKKTKDLRSRVFLATLATSLDLLWLLEMKKRRVVIK
jgi:hypothetical protein